VEEWKQWQLKLVSKRVIVIKAVLSAKVSLRSFHPGVQILYRMLYVPTATAAAFRLDNFYAGHCHSMSDAEGYIHSRKKIQMTLACT